MGSTAMAVPEIALQGTQEYRSAVESFLNIGVGTVIGGGFGAFSRAHFADSPLHPANMLNPFRRDAQHPMTFRTPDGLEDTIVPGASTVGASAAPGGPVASKGVLSSTGPGGKWLADKITGATPAGRALQWTSGKARTALVRMMDLGGTLTDLNRYGIRTEISAEDIKRDLTVAWERLALTGDRVLNTLNRELGQNPALATLGIRGTVASSDFADLTRKLLKETFTDADRAALRSQYGEEAAGKIEGAAKELADKVHETNAAFEKELVRLGELRDEALTKKLKGELDTVRSEIKNLRQQISETKKANAEAAKRGGGEFTPTDVSGLEAEVEKLRGIRAEKQAAYLAEAGKAQALGRKYGYAQLWDTDNILAKQEAFRDLLYEVMIDTPDEAWMVGRYGIDAEDFGKLGTEDVRIFRDEEEVVLSPAEGAALRKEIVSEWAGDELGFKIARAELAEENAKFDLKQAELDLAEVARQYGIADRATARLNVSQARKLRDKIGADIAAAEAEKIAAAAEAKALMEAATAARTQTLARQLEVAEGGVPTGAKTIDTAVAATRAQEAALRLRSADARLKRMQARQARFERALANVEAKAEMARVTRENAEVLVEQLGKNAKLAGKELAAARRELVKLNKRTPLASVVDEIIQTLVDKEKLPIAVMDRVAPVTGRAKARMINLTPEQTRRAEDLGLLRSDLTNILALQYQQLAGHIGLVEGLGIGKGRAYESWQAVLDEVNNDYIEMAARTPEKSAAFEAERRRVVKDLNLLKERLLGMENIGADREGWFNWVSGKMRQANFIRYGSGFLIPSFTDIAVVHLQHGSLAKLLQKHGRQAAEIMMQAYKENPSEFVAMFHATELGSSGLRFTQSLDVDDTLNITGIGPKGTLKHNVTSAVDRGMKWMSDKTMSLSGLRTWNRFWKITAAVHRSYALRDQVAKYASLSDLDKAKLASLGVGAGEANRLNRFLQKYGTTDENGFFDPGLEQWVREADGREAARDFRIAIERDMTRSVFTPGIGDTPALMSHSLGKLWLQFQTFAFAFTNRFMIPASQRLATYRDAQALASYGHLVWAGLAVVLMKDVINGRDPMERFQEDKWGETAAEIVDRSGMLAYMSPYVDSLLKVPFGDGNVGSALGVGPTSRYQRNNWWQSMLGANFGLARDTADFIGAASTADREQMIKKGLNIAPFGAHLRMIHRLGNPDQ
jgi:hypothetical protein